MGTSCGRAVLEVASGMPYPASPWIALVTRISLADSRVPLILIPVPEATSWSQLVTATASLQSSILRETCCGRFESAVQGKARLRNNKSMKSPLEDPEMLSLSAIFEESLRRMCLTAPI